MAREGQLAAEARFERLLRMGLAARYAAPDVPWETGFQLAPRQLVALARTLTPVYLGEQAATAGAAAVLPELVQRGETASYLYLTTFILDEGRHVDVLTELYRRAGHDPVSLREMPEMLRYHHRLVQARDRLQWIWGILISDLFARSFYGVFARRQREAVFGQISEEILVDEGRHQAFSEAYLAQELPHLGSEYRRALLAMRDDLLRSMEAMNRQLRADTELLGFDGGLLLEQIAAQLQRIARRIGLDGPPPDPPSSGPDRHDPSPQPPGSDAPPGAGDARALPAGVLRERRLFAGLATPCGGCPLAMRCGRPVEREAA